MKRQKNIYKSLRREFKICSYNDYLALDYTNQHDVCDYLIRYFFIEDDPYEIRERLGGPENRINLGIEGDQLLKHKRKNVDILKSLSLFSCHSLFSIGSIQYDAYSDLVTEMPINSMIETLFNVKPLIETSLASIIPKSLIIHEDDKETGGRWAFDVLDPNAYSLYEEEDLVFAATECDDDLARLEHGDISRYRELGYMQQFNSIHANLNNSKLFKKLTEMSRCHQENSLLGMLRFSSDDKCKTDLQRFIELRSVYSTDFNIFQKTIYEFFNNINSINSENKIINLISDIDDQIACLNDIYKRAQKSISRKQLLVLSGLGLNLAVLLYAPPEFKNDFIKLFTGISCYKGIEFFLENNIPEAIRNSPFWFPWYVKFGQFNC